MSNTSATVPAQNAVVTPKTLEERFGKGKYFSLQCEVFKDCQRIFQIPEDKSEKIAKAVSTHLGTIFSKGQVVLKLGDKLNKDGQIRTISEAVKLKNVALTYEIAMLRAIDYCNKHGQYHVNAVFTLNSDMTEWITKM